MPQVYPRIGRLRALERFRNRHAETCARLPEVPKKSLAPACALIQNTPVMASDLLITKIGKATIAEFQSSSLMDPIALESMQSRLISLVDEQDLRILILDFSRVEYLSSQAIGIVILLHRKLSALPHSKFFLCGVKPKLAELLRLTRLDKILKIKESQKEAVTAAVQG
jgi:anti-sigma B factor antagonist